MSAGMGEGDRSAAGSAPRSGTSTAAGGDSEALLDALLYSASHDLRSPLLALSLSAELVAGAVTDGSERVRLALDSLSHGTQDIARMLDALTAVSRARRRSLAPQAVALPDLLGRRAAVADPQGAAQVRVVVDARIVDELLALLGGDAPPDVQWMRDGDAVQLVAPLPATSPLCEQSPLATLLGSLQTYAGTPVATLAALQVQIDRCGGTLSVSEGLVRVRLPAAAS